MDLPRALITVLGIVFGTTMAMADLLAEPVDSGRASPASDDGGQPPLVQNAVAAFRQGDLKATLNLLRQAHESDPELPPAEVMLANMFYSNDEPQKGRQALERAAVEHPADPEPHLIFGDLAWRERRLSDAQVQYERGGKLTASFNGSPERKHALKVRALVGLANVAEARGQYEEAHKWLTALLSVDPQHAHGHFRLGNVLFQLSRDDEALAAFRTAARWNESAPSPLLTLAELYQQAGKTDQAEKWINEAIEESPDDFHTQLEMARWQLEQHHALEAAAQHVERAAQFDPGSPEVPLLRGLIAWAQGDLRLAEQEFESIYLKDPAQRAAVNHLAAVLAEQDDPARRMRAHELIELTGTSRGGVPATVAAAGWVAFHRGDLERAHALLQSAAAAPGAGRDTTYYLARIQFRRGQIVAARDSLQRALTANGLFVHRDEARRWQRELNISADGQ